MIGSDFPKSENLAQVAPKVSFSFCWKKTIENLVFKESQLPTASYV
jgi:hypothetical protein